MSRSPASPLFAQPASAADDEETYLDQPIELDPLEDGGNDDQEASDLIVGEEIDVLGETLGDNEPVELDLGTLVSLDDAKSNADDEDDSGFEVDPAVGLALPDALTPDDGAEGVPDSAFAVDESKFPSLEHDDGSEGIAAEREISLGIASDEASLPMAAEPWRSQPSSSSLEACSALALGVDAVAAASSDLLWFRTDAATPLRVALDGSAISDLVLCGANQDVALASTQTGQIFRRARFASQAEQLTRLREQLKPAGAQRLGPLFFGGSLGARNGRILLRTDEGSLLEIFDSGDRVERIEFDGKVIALSRESTVCLLARDRTRSLQRLDGALWQTQALSGSALLVAQSPTPLLASSGPALALAERGGALLVSVDQGKSFQRVPGSNGVSALAGAELPEGARFFAALYRETSDETRILLVDPERAEAICIASIEASAEQPTSDPADRGEWAKVTRLAWHAGSNKLWAVGGFGVRGFTPS